MDSRLTEAVIPPLVLLGVMDLGARQGCDVRSWFAGTGLSAEAMTTVEAKISFAQAATVLKRALGELPGPVGIQVGTRDALQSYGMLGLAVRSCATMAEAVRVGMELHQASGSLTDADAEFRGDQFALRLYERAPEPALLRFLCEESFFSTLLLFRSFAGAHLEPLLVECAYPAPEYANAYRRFFRCPVRFDAQANRMSFPVSMLSDPIATYNPVSLELSVQACRRLVSSEPGAPDVVAAVESLLAETIRRPLSMAQVAERMYTTERSLRRRLAAHGHRFEELRGRVRRRRAEFLLERTNLPVTRIAEEVGYQDPREFRRAFVRWTGETPTARRQRAADAGRSITQ